MSKIHKTLSDIQVRLVAQKNAYNKHGKYNYRNIESILESLKPLLKEHGCTVHLTDDVVFLGDRFYIKATATLTDSEGESVSTTSFAREPDKGMGGMSESQTTGSSSSYARKYALGGLFAIDDNADDDSINNHQPVQQLVQQQSVKQPVQLDATRFQSAVDAIKGGQSKEPLLDSTRYTLTAAQLEIIRSL